MRNKDKTQFPLLAPVGDELVPFIRVRVGVWPQVGLEGCLCGLPTPWWC